MNLDPSPTPGTRPAPSLPPTSASTPLGGPCSHATHAGEFDAGWRSRAMAGEQAAVGRLADAVTRPLFAFCLYRLGRDRAACEEVVQETLLRALRELNKYDPARCDNDVFGWLTGLARNEIGRALAAARRNPAASLQNLWERVDEDLLRVYSRLESEPFGDDLLEREETRQVVNATMAQIPPHYREALEAKYVRGRSVREMAGEARVSEKAVESQLTRARQAFRSTFLALTNNLGRAL